MKYTILNYDTFDSTTPFNAKTDKEFVESLLFTNIHFGHRTKIYPIMYNQEDSVITNVQPDITAPLSISELKDSTYTYIK